MHQPHLRPAASLPDHPPRRLPGLRPGRPERARYDWAGTGLHRQLLGGARRWAVQVGWLISGLPPSRIGWSDGPLRVWRQARQRRVRKPLRLLLLERHTSRYRYGAALSFWLNERSRVLHVEVNGRPEDADVVWVFDQDPLEPTVRAAHERDLARVRPGVPVINPPQVYDAYHQEDCFPRLAAAGVHVPRHHFGPDDVGVTEVVYKALGEQASRKERLLYHGPMPGFRAFEFVDGRGADGRTARYRAYYLAGLVVPTDVLRSREWNVHGGTFDQVDHAYTLTAEEREQVVRVAEALHLDFFCIDFIRRSPDGLPVVVDVNVYPTIVGVEGRADLGDRGRWHHFDTPARRGLRHPDDEETWRLVDEAFVQLVAGGQHRTRRTDRPTDGHAPV